MENFSNTILTTTTKAMLRQEERGYICKDYLHQQHKFDANNMTGALHRRVLNGNNRRNMIDWYYQVADFCHLNYETLEVATSYLDRFIATETGSKALTDSDYFQLAGMTSLYTAVKIYEVEVMDLAILSKLSHGLYSEEEIERTEMEILTALQWRVNPPTALAFVRRFLHIIPSYAAKTTTSNSTSTSTSTMNDTIYNLSQIQTELSLRDNRLLTVRNSTIAFASLMNSLESISCLDRQTIELIGCHISNITSIDCCSKYFMDIKSLLHSNIDQGCYDSSECHTNIQSHSAGSSVKDSTTKSYSKQSLSQGSSPRSHSYVHII